MVDDRQFEGVEGVAKIGWQIGQVLERPDWRRLLAGVRIGAIDRDAVPPGDLAGSVGSVCVVVARLGRFLDFDH